MKKTNFKFIALLSAIAALVAIGVSAVVYNTGEEIEALSKHSPTIIGSASGRVAGIAVETARLQVDRVGGNTFGTEITVDGTKTVLDALEEMSTAFGIELQTKKYDFGTSIEGIGDLVAGDEDRYWIYYVNGEMAMNAVDLQILDTGDDIEFRFEASTF